MSLLIFDVSVVLYKETSVIPGIADYLKVSRESFLEMAIENGVLYVQAGSITEEEFCARLSSNGDFSLSDEIWTRFFDPEPLDANLRQIL